MMSNRRAIIIIILIRGLGGVCNPLMITVGAREIRRNGDYRCWLGVRNRGSSGAGGGGDELMAATAAATGVRPATGLRLYPFLLFAAAHCTRFPSRTTSAVVGRAPKLPSPLNTPTLSRFNIIT